MNEEQLTKELEELITKLGRIRERIDKIEREDRSVKRRRLSTRLGFLRTSV